MAQAKTRFERRMVATALSVLLCATAEAAVYSAVYDPPGTGTVPGFTGVAQFTIDDDCFTLGNGWFETSNPSAGSTGCGFAFMDSATVYLYSEDPLLYPVTPTPSNALGTFSFDPPANEDVNGILIVGGALVAVDTGLMGPRPGTGDYVGQDFWLQFVTECVNNSCFSTDLTAFSAAALPGSPLPGGYIFQDCTSTNGCDPSNRATVVFTRIDQVPEPGTLALLLGALGLGWLVRRRFTR